MRVGFLKNAVLALVLAFSGREIVMGQSVDYELEFKAWWGEDKLQLKHAYHHQGQTLQLDRFLFYLSGLDLLRRGEVVASIPESRHLFDFEDTTTHHWKFSLPKPIKFDAIRFHLGIDSLTQVSGAYGGVLDPTSGMYWAWQSGFINVKIEGESTLCSTRQNKFKFHLGGYFAPFNTLQVLEFESKRGKLPTIFVDLQRYFSALDLMTTNEVMSPSKTSVSLASQVKNSFFVRP
jgi:hypothetical protein